MKTAELSRRARDWWLEFRARSVYFQLKALVLVLYGLVVAVTLIWAPPPSQAKNQIGASILVLEGDMVVGRYFIIENQSRNHWQAVRFEIDGGYVVHRDLVAAGEKVTLYVKDFKKKVIYRRRGREIPKTVSAPIDMPLARLSVTCSEGTAITQIDEQGTRGQDSGL
jgi:hypothetical protein